MPHADPRIKEAASQVQGAFALRGCIIEEGTRRISLINVFDTFRLPSFPGGSSGFTLFLQLVDGIGRYQLEIQVIDLEQDRVIGQTNATAVEFPVRPMKQSIVIPVRSLKLPHAGKFDVLVSSDGDEIERQSFTAKLAGDRP